MSKKTENKSSYDEEITLELSDESVLNFKVTPKHYSQFINDVSGANKVQAAKNFLSRCVQESDKESLAILIANPANAMALVGELVEDYGTIEVLVKKRKNEKPD